MAIWFAILQNTKEGIQSLEDDDFKTVFMKQARQMLQDHELVKFEKVIDTVIKNYKNKTIKY